MVHRAPALGSVKPHDKTCNARRPLARIGLCEHQRHLSAYSVCNPLFAPSESPTALHLACRHFDGGEVAARVVLRHGGTADELAAQHRGHIARAGLGATVFGDAQDRVVVVNEGERKREVHTR